MNPIEATIETVQEVLCHLAGFPERRIADMSPADSKAVEFLTTELWMPKASQQRMEIYMQLVNMYGEDGVPEHVWRLAEIMTCRYTLPKRMQIGIDLASGEKKTDSKSGYLTPAGAAAMLLMALLGLAMLAFVLVPPLLEVAK